jgi:hypothetical protein
MAGAIILLRIVIENEFQSLDLGEPGQSGERLLVKGLVYFLLLTIAMLVYATRARTLLVAPVVGAVSGLLSTRLFRRPMQRTHRVILYGGVLGLMMSQVVWALNYWQIPSLSGGLLLLLIFYVATGVVEQSMLGRMSGRVLVEYGVIALIAAVAILRSQACSRFPRTERARVPLTSGSSILGRFQSLVPGVGASSTSGVGLGGSVAVGSGRSVGVGDGSGGWGVGVDRPP